MTTVPCGRPGCANELSRDQKRYCCVRCAAAHQASLAREGRPISKPCGCGREGCVVEHEGLAPAVWARRKYRDLKCAGRAAKALTAVYRGRPVDRVATGINPNRGALITEAAWLELPPARLRIRAEAEGIRL